MHFPLSTNYEVRSSYPEYTWGRHEKVQAFMMSFPGWCGCSCGSRLNPRLACLQGVVQLLLVHRPLFFSFSVSAFVAFDSVYQQQLQLWSTLRLIRPSSAGPQIPLWLFPISNTTECPCFYCWCSTPWENNRHIPEPISLDTSWISSTQTNAKKFLLLVLCFFFGYDLHQLQLLSQLPKV